MACASPAIGDISTLLVVQLGQPWPSTTRPIRMALQTITRHGPLVWIKGAQLGTSLTYLSYMYLGTIYVEPPAGHI